jgi:hypothetical protein
VDVVAILDDAANSRRATSVASRAPSQTSMATSSCSGSWWSNCAARSPRILSALGVSRARPRGGRLARPPHRRLVPELSRRLVVDLALADARPSGASVAIRRTQVVVRITRGGRVGNGRERRTNSPSTSPDW